MTRVSLIVAFVKMAFAFTLFTSVSVAQDGRHFDYTHMHERSYMGCILYFSEVIISRGIRPSRAVDEAFAACEEHAAPIRRAILDLEGNSEVAESALEDLRLDLRTEALAFVMDRLLGLQTEAPPPPSTPFVIAQSRVAYVERDYTIRLFDGSTIRLWGIVPKAFDEPDQAEDDRARRDFLLWRRFGVMVHRQLVTCFSPPQPPYREPQNPEGTLATCRLESEADPHLDLGDWLVVNADFEYAEFDADTGGWLTVDVRSY